MSLRVPGFGYGQSRAPHCLTTRIARYSRQYVMFVSQPNHAYATCATTSLPAFSVCPSYPAYTSTQAHLPSPGGRITHGISYARHIYLQCCICNNAALPTLSHVPASDLSSDFQRQNRTVRLHGHAGQCYFESAAKSGDSRLHTNCLCLRISEQTPRICQEPCSGLSRHRRV